MYSSVMHSAYSAEGAHIQREYTYAKTCTRAYRLRRMHLARITEKFIAYRSFIIGAPVEKEVEHDISCAARVQLAHLAKATQNMNIIHILKILKDCKGKRLLALLYDDKQRSQYRTSSCERI